MDLAGSNSTLGISYGVEPSTTFSEAVRVGASGSDDDMKRIIQNMGENLSLLVCGGEPILAVRPNADSVEALVSRIMKKSPVVVVDLSGASRDVQKRILALASSVFLVTTPILSALRNTRTYLSEIKSIRNSLDDVNLVVNRIGLAGSDEVGMKDIQAALSKEPAAKVPFEPKVFLRSEATGKPVGQDKEAVDVVKAIIPLVARAVGVEVKAEAGGQKDDLFSALKKKLAGK
jgi:pilus assembly protein CpaE